MADYIVTIEGDRIVKATEVVRCGECEFYDVGYRFGDRWCRRLGLVGAFDWNQFCCHGERREDERTDQ